MAIRSITQSEFDSFKPARSAMIAAFVEEVEWFADDANNIIGTLVRDKTDNDWSYVVLGRDERGVFRAVQFKTSIEERTSAKSELLAVMSKIEASKQTVFAQGD